MALENHSIQNNSSMGVGVPLVDFLGVMYVIICIIVQDKHAT